MCEEILYFILDSSQKIRIISHIVTKQKKRGGASVLIEKDGGWVYTTLRARAVGF
jgi:hypothetical protein